MEDFVEENVGETEEALSVSVSQSVLPARGGNGGTASTLSCPGGYVAVGIYGQAGSWINQLGLNCALLKSDGTLGSPVSTGSDGGSGGSSFQYDCPNNQAIVGFSGRAGWYVDQLGVYCSEIKNWRSNGTIQFKSPAAGGSGGTKFNDYCPASYVLTSVSVRTGWWVDREQGTCSYITE